MQDTQQGQHDLKRLANELREARRSLSKAGAFEGNRMQVEEAYILAVEEELLDMADDLWMEGNLQELVAMSAHANGQRVEHIL